MKNHLILIVFLFLLTTGFIRAQDGVLKFYYPNGKLESEISYVKDVLNGFSIWYFENGNKKKEAFYKDGKLNGWVRYFYETGLVKAEFSVTDGVRDGLTKFYYPNGALKEVRTYRKGVLTKKIELDRDETYVPPLDAYSGAVKQLENRKNGNNFLCEVELCPEPIGGIQAIRDKLVYPEHARLYGLEGKVILKVYVDKRGDAQQIEVAKGLGLGCTESAINAVRSVKFLPGENNGEIVSTWVAITIDFKLSEEKSKKEIAFQPEIEMPEFLYEEPFGESEEKSVATLPVLPDTIAVAENVPTLTSEITGEELEPVIEEENKVTEISGKKEEVKQQLPNENKFDNRIRLLGCDLQVCPEPKGGIETIRKNLIVPSKVKRLKLEGVVLVEAVIDKFGYVRDTKVLQKMGHGCDEAAEVAILDTHFFPGKNGKEPKRTKLKIAIPFSYRN